MSAATKVKKLSSVQIVWFASYGLLLTGIYYSSYFWLVSHDWVKEDFSYCYLVPVISLYLLWEKREEFAAPPSVPSWSGLMLIIFGLHLFWLGELAGEFFTIYISSWLTAVGLLWLHLGWKKLKTILFPLFFLLTMFPLPNFLYNKVSVALKLISSQLGVAMMQLFGMSAYREGNIIDLGFTQLQVVDACSGLRYLIPLIVLGILLAYFFKAPLWKRLALVISTVPLSILTNSLRIASVGVLYQFWGPAVAEGFFHDFSGWFIFMVTLAFLLLEMWILNKIPIGRVSDSPKSKGHDRPGQKHESLQKKAAGAKRGLLGATLKPQFIVAILLLGATLALAQGIEFREKVPIAKSLDQFPLQIGKWQGERQTMEQRFLDELDLSDYVIIDYQDSQGKNINFYVAYYESQRKGESIHSPASCLPGSGWIFNQSGMASIPVAAGTDQSFMKVNRAFMQKGGYKQLSYYWFPQRGRVLTNAYQLKIFAFWDALTKQRTDGALVRVITPVYGSEKMKDAEARLQSFSREMVPVLAEFLPGK